MGSYGPAWCQEHHMRPLPKPKGTPVPQEEGPVLGRGQTLLSCSSRGPKTHRQACVCFSCADEHPQSQTLPQACRSDVQASSPALGSGSPRVGTALTPPAGQSSPRGCPMVRAATVAVHGRPWALTLHPFWPHWRESSAHEDSVMMLGPWGPRVTPFQGLYRLIPPAKSLCM